MKIKTLSLLIFLLVIFAINSQAQELNLFQSVDSNEQQTNSRRPQRASTANTTPAFTLVGTSRFGDEYYASLLSRDGEAITIEWSRGSLKAIKGHDGYLLADIGSRSVSLRVPSSDPCIENSEKGVSCNDNIAILTLSNAKPIEARQVETTIISDSNETDPDSDEMSEEDPVTIGNTNVLIRNPFNGELQSTPDLTPEQLAAREERRARRAEQFRNFEIVRIPDDEIPEGMQRVRTPFGDSLEPAED